MNELNSDTLIRFRVPAVIDDRTALPNYKGFHRQVFEIDLQDLKLMNSAGIRNWVNWLRSFEPQNEVRLSSCTLIFLNISAFVHDVAPPNVKIQSVILRYSDAASGNSLRVLSTRPSSSEWQIPAEIEETEGSFEFDGILTKSLARLKSDVKFIDNVPLSQASVLGIEVLEKV